MYIVRTQKGIVAKTLMEEIGFTFHDHPTGGVDDFVIANPNGHKFLGADEETLIWYAETVLRLNLE